MDQRGIEVHIMTPEQFDIFARSACAREISNFEAHFLSFRYIDRYSVESCRHIMPFSKPVAKGCAFSEFKLP